MVPDPLFIEVRVCTGLSGLGWTPVPDQGGLPWYIKGYKPPSCQFVSVWTCGQGGNDPW